MTDTVPLLQPYEPGKVLLWRYGSHLNQGELLARANGLARRLRGATHVLNLCDDRAHFMVGYAAALIAGATTLLPPNRAPVVIRELCGNHAGPPCIADHDDVPGDCRTLRVSFSEPPGAHPREVPRIPAAHPAAVLFTSGSTGVPSPTTKTWGALVEGARTLRTAFAMESTDGASLIGTVPPQHMFGLESTVMLPLWSGLAVNATRPLLPADIAATNAAMPGAKWLMTTPLHLRVCVEAGVALTGLRGVISSTMPLPQSLAVAAETKWGVPVHEIYGCSEAGMVATRRVTRDARWCLARSVRAWQVHGETWIQGGHVQQPVLLADRIELHDERHFTLHGRHADMVKIAGKRTSLPELDAQLVGIDGVVDGAFIIPDDEDPGRMRLTALVVAPDLPSGALLARLRERIDPVFLPRPLHRVTALPRNGNGKLSRAAVLALLATLQRGHDRGGRA